MVLPSGSETVVKLMLVTFIALFCTKVKRKREKGFPLIAQLLIGYFGFKRNGRSACRKFILILGAGEAPAP